VIGGKEDKGGDLKDLLKSIKNKFLILLRWKSVSMKNLSERNITLTQVRRNPSRRYVIKATREAGCDRSRTCISEVYFFVLAKYLQGRFSSGFQVKKGPKSNEGP
jgi:hypothetical protein